MNQTPSSILVLSAAILSYGAAARSYDPTGVVLGLAAVLVGVWGVISLIGASIRERESLVSSHMRSDLMDRVLGRDSRQPQRVPVATLDDQEFELSPEIKAQLSMTAHLEGRDRSQIIEEALRRYLPRYERTKAA